MKPCPTHWKYGKVLPLLTSGDFNIYLKAAAHCTFGRDIARSPRGVRAETARHISDFPRGKSLVRATQRNDNDFLNSTKDHVVKL